MPDVASSSARDTDLIIRRTSYSWLALDLCKLLGIYLSFMLLAVIVLGLFWEAMKYTLWGMPIGASTEAYRRSVERDLFRSPAGSKELRFISFETDEFGSPREGFWLTRDIGFGLRVVAVKGFPSRCNGRVDVHWLNEDSCEIRFFGGTSSAASNREVDSDQLIRYWFP